MTQKPAYAIVYLPSGGIGAHSIHPSARAAMLWAERELARHKGSPTDFLSRWERDRVRTGGHELFCTLLSSSGKSLECFALVGVP